MLKRLAIVIGGLLALTFIPFWVANLLDYLLGVTKATHIVVQWFAGLLETLAIAIGLLVIFLLFTKIYQGIKYLLRWIVNG